MYEYLVLLAILISIASYYSYFKPKSLILKFTQQDAIKKYKTILLPFYFMKYYLVHHFVQNQHSLQQLKQSWSKYDIIVGNAFSNLGIMVGKPDLIKDVCNQSNKFQKSPFTSQVFRAFNGGGIVFSEGQIWKRKRRIISTVFHYEFLNNMIPVIQSQIDQSFKQVDSKIKQGDKQINIRQIITKILSNVVAKCFFGTDMKHYVIEGKPFCESFLQFLDSAGLYIISWQHSLFGMKCYNYKLTKKSRQLRRKYELIQSILKEVIIKELDKIKNNQEKNKNILTALYENNMLNLENQVQNQHQYTMYELIGQFFAFFGAGADSTSNSINLALHYLSQNPIWIEKIKEQVKEVEQQNLDTLIKLKKYKVCEAVFQQTLRLNNPAPILMSRRTLEDVKIGDKIIIPKNTIVSVSPLICHYKEQHFKNPHDFIPQRWLQDQKLQPYMYLPFSGGQRNCIGQYLAKIEAKLLLSKVCTTYKFKALNEIKMKHHFIYSTKYGTFQMEKIQ